MGLLDDTRGLDHALPYVVLRVARLLRFHLRQMLAARTPALSPEQWFVLFRLYERDGRPQNELTDPTLDDRPNITRLLGGLERHGLVHREPDRADRRRVLVHLTAAGRAYVDDFLPDAVAERKRIFAQLSEAEVRQFHADLLTLEGNLRGRLGDGEVGSL